MPSQMTSQERFRRMFEHREADRVPIIDSPWSSTLERWHREGLPKDVDWADYFGLDHVCGIGADTGPRYPRRVLEETDEYLIETTDTGATWKNWKHTGSTPQFLDAIVTDPDKWREAKKRMTPARDRVDWDFLKKHYPEWRRQGRWILAHLWFGFDITHSRMVGTERLLVALLDTPEWCVDMFNTQLDLNLALFNMVWDEGYRFDAISWPDDLGYKGDQFMSLGMYRELLKPVHRRAADWAHAKGVKVMLHSCGDVRPFIPEFLELGIDCLNPIEVKAGMDPIALKRQYGDRLVLYGGINAALWDRPDAIQAEIERVLPVIKQRGGYIFSSDHSIPDSISLKDFQGIVALAKRLGTYV